MLDKFSVIACESKESSQLLDIGWGWPILNSLDLGWFSGKTLAGYNMAKILNALLGKCTFRFLNQELIGSNDLEHLVQVVHMLIQCLAIYQYVIHEYKNTFSQ